MMLMTQDLRNVWNGENGCLLHSRRKK